MTAVPPASETPTLAYVRQRLARFHNDPRYYDADPAVRLVFQQWPRNTDQAQVRAKAAVLNSLYNTVIFDLDPVVSHSCRLDIDARLAAADQTLVDDLARICFKDRTRNCLSFASKYCAWHQPDLYQMYDSLVVEMLWRYRKAHDFAQFRRNTLDTYPGLLKVIERFRDYFGLRDIDRFTLDKFLWIEAKELKL